MEHRQEVSPLPKHSTGVAGLDEVLHGGVPAGRVSIVAGGPGTGKTLLGLSFLLAGATDDEPGVLVTFEERADALRANAASLGLDLAAVERAGRLHILDVSVDVRAVPAGEFDLGGTLAILRGKAAAMGARRIVVDAVDVLLRTFHDPRREEEQLRLLHDGLRATELTSLLTVKSDGQHRQYELLDYAADCVMRLDHRVAGQVATRRLRVSKYRGSGFQSGEIPYSIGPSGVTVLPVGAADLATAPLDQRLPSGVAGLDELIEGGVRAGSALLVGGASGTGKTILACSFASAACARDERVLYVSYEESADSLLRSVRAPGVDLAPFVRSGALRFRAVLPEAVGAEDHLAELLHTIRTFRPHHVVLDAISALRRMGAPLAVFDVLLRLLSACKERGTTTLLLQQSGVGAAPGSVAGDRIASLVDGIVLLDLDVRGDMLERRLTVSKMRGTAHSLGRHPLRIDGGGLHVDHDLGRPAADRGDGGSR